MIHNGIIEGVTTALTKTVKGISDVFETRKEECVNGKESIGSGR